MKAVLCHAIGPAECLVVEEIATPAPGAGAVLVEDNARTVP